MQKEPETASWNAPTQRKSGASLQFGPATQIYILRNGMMNKDMEEWCRGVGTAASIVVRVGVRVRVSGGSGGLKNTRIIERTQRFILV